jgi:hypothetical protein
MIEANFIQIIISIVGVISPVIFGVIKYVDHKTGAAETRLRAEIGELKAQQLYTQSELRKISENLLEIRTLLFGALNHPGILSKDAV